MTPAEATPGNQSPVSFPAPRVELVSKGSDRPPVPIVRFPAGRRRLPGAGQ